MLNFQSITKEKETFKTQEANSLSHTHGISLLTLLIIVN